MTLNLAVNVVLCIWKTILCLTSFTLIYLSLTVQQAIFAYVNHRIYSWNQSVLLSNESEVSCSRKQWETLMGLKLITDWLQSDILPTASSRTLFLTYFGWFSFHNICVTMTLGWSRLPVFRSKLFYRLGVLKYW